MDITSRKNAPRQGSNAVPDSKGGKFTAAMQKLAKLHSKKRSKGPIQVGNVLTKKAPMGGKVPFGSKIDKPEGGGVSVQATKGQKALNDEQE